MLNPVQPSRINALQDFNQTMNLDDIIRKTEQLLSKSSASKYHASDDRETLKKETWDKPLDYYIALENIQEAKRIAAKLANEENMSLDSHLINPWNPDNQNKIRARDNSLFPISKRIFSSYASKAGKISTKSKIIRFCCAAKNLLRSHKIANVN